jgi:hypothetical protein
MRRVSKLSSPTLFYSLLGVVFDPARCLANVQMHPSIRRDFARLGQLEHVHWRRVNSAAFSKYSKYTAVTSNCLKLFDSGQELRQRRLCSIVIKSRVLPSEFDRKLF